MILRNKVILAKRKRLNLATPLNLVCTADIIGGNSGSPVVNRQGQFVGIIFDGNIQSLTGDFLYTEDQSRALAVHSSAIIEALQKVYDARPLADELLGK
jgi:V8-like Glu-specific endopeptidase